MRLKKGHDHHMKVVSGSQAHKVLNWVGTFASKAKAFGLNPYYDLRRKHLRSYSA